MNLSWQEQHCAKAAVEVIKKNGGTIAFDEYDKAMYQVIYFSPISWASIGFDLGYKTKKMNKDKLCVFAACKAGMVRQTETGYELI